VPPRSCSGRWWRVADDAGPVVVAAAWGQSWVWVPAFAPLLTVLPLLHPDGRLPSPRWRPVLGAGLAGTVLLTAAVALHPDVVRGGVDVVSPSPPTRSAGCCWSRAPSSPWQPSPPDRSPSWCGSGARAGSSAGRVVVVLSAALLLVLEAAVNGALPSAVGAVTQPVAVVLLPVAVASRPPVTACTTSTSRVLRALVGASPPDLPGRRLPHAVRAGPGGRPGRDSAGHRDRSGITGLAVQPWAPARAPRPTGSTTATAPIPSARCPACAARLRDDVAVDEVPAAVCEAVCATLRLPAAELCLDDGRTAGRAGDAVDGPSADVALTHRGEQVGVLRVALRRGERVLHVRDRAVLGALADQAAPAVASRALRGAAGLPRGAGGLAEKERRRLRRDLHDGVGRCAGGARLQLESARDRVADEGAARLLDGAGRAVAEAVDDVRRLTDDLPPRPSTSSASPQPHGPRARSSTPDRRVAVAVAALPDLPAATEVAVHRIAAEALANAARHSGAQNVSLRCTSSRPSSCSRCATTGAASTLAPSGRRSGTPCGSGPRSWAGGWSCCPHATAAHGARGPAAGPARRAPQRPSASSPVGTA
jgi:hypothetical protein